MPGEGRFPNALDFAAQTLTDRVIVMPWKRFRRAAASSGIVLVIVAIIAMIWANSPWAHAYHHVFHEVDLSASLNAFAFSVNLHQVINDALMALFFLLVGMEIKREVLYGDLNDPKRAVLPVAAAIGGMLVPAAIYFLVIAINPAGVDGGSLMLRGWGVPMATDIAFALGILALLGRRVPSALRVFLCTLAVADDLGALLVIAVFYTESLEADWLWWTLVVFALMFLCARLRIREPRVYAFLGLGMLITLGLSGVHPTIAGVLVATQIPASARVDARSFIMSARAALDYFEHHAKRLRHRKTTVAMGRLSTEQIAAARSIAASARHIRPPMQRIEQSMSPWVNFVVLPLFALANAGVAIGGSQQAVLLPSTIAIFAGLLVGKPLGIMLACWICVKLGWARLPSRVTWWQMLGVSILGGIGFTMAIFITQLAFGSDIATEGAKLAILAASFAAALLGLVVLVLSTRERIAALRTDELEETIDEPSPLSQTRG